MLQREYPTLCILFSFGMAKEEAGPALANGSISQLEPGSPCMCIEIDGSWGWFGFIHDEPPEWWSSDRWPAEVFSAVIDIQCLRSPLYVVIYVFFSSVHSETSQNHRRNNPGSNYGMCL